MKTRSIILAFAVVFVTAGCFDQIKMGHRPGQPVVFSATSKSPSVQTKTWYSGSKYVPSNLERIDWIDGDQIYVFSAETEDGNYKTYTVTGSTKEDMDHYGTLAAVGAEMKWGDATTHTFYSMYPAPGYSGAQTGISLDNNVVTAVLPANQSSNLTSKPASEGESYYGNMTLAYMTAATTGQLYSDDPVILSFTPIVTTFYVTIVNNYPGNDAMNLQKIILSSATQAMTGTYKATMTNVSGNNYNRAYTYAESGWGSIVTRTEANSSITFDWTGGAIANGSSVTIALFALPQTITEVTLTVVTAEGQSTLELKKNGNWIQFTGGNKHNISNLGVPEWEYDIDICDVDDTPATFNYTYTAGSTESQAFSVRSRKSSDGGNTWIPTPWKAQYWSDTDGDGVEDSDEWFDVNPSSYPAWLSSLSPVTYSPSTANYENTGHAVTMTPQDLQSHEETLRTRWVSQIEAAKRNTNGAYDKARINLHQWNHITHALGAATTTANCYIVQGPGDYIFPMVYGNGIDQEFLGLNPNEKAYNPDRVLNDYLNNFHNHCRNTFDYLGIATSDRIKDAWISRHGTSTTLGVTSDYYGHHCTEVGILWQDFKNGENVITNVGYLETNTYADNKSDRYVTFSVGQNISPGNALIYVKDVNLNVIAWSWHIWITDQNLSPVEMRNSSSNTFHIQPINLGWVDDADGIYYPPRTGKIRFVCVEHPSTVSPTLTLDQADHENESTSGWAPYYQWGRKDPIRSGSTLVSDEPHHIYYSIQNPDKFLSAKDVAQDEYDWSDNDYLNMWRYDYHKEGISSFDPFKNTAVQKSVYDPCPRGYKVPAGNTWTGLDLSGTLITGKGRYFPTASGGQIFFPAKGFINGVNVLTDDGVAGMYWLDVPEGDLARDSYCLNYNLSSISAPGYVQRAYGLSVRCEREDANTTM